MATITHFEDIEAWRLGRELKNLVYTYSKSGEFARDFPLRDQIRRAVISVTANIAEGFEREGNREFVQFLSTAKGSCGEVQDHLYTALDQSYLQQKQFDDLYLRCAEVSRKIGALMNYLQGTEIRGREFNRTSTDDDSRNSKPKTRGPNLHHPSQG